MASLYISPTGSGRMDGSSIENAARLSSLNTLIGKAGAGGEVLLIADQGAYTQTSQIAITKGGAEDLPVTIRGIDSHGNSMDATIIGSRAQNWAPGMPNGAELFRLLDGADNLTFEDIDVRNVGNGAFRIGADIENLTIRQIDAANVATFIEDYKSGTATSATISGLTVEDCTIAGYSANAIRLQYDSHDITISNVVGDSQGQNGGIYVHGIALDGTVHDVVIQQTEMKNNFGNGTSKEYWNGDGFATERGVYNVTFIDTLASGNTDAGYDLKSSNTVLIRATSEGNNENFRFWSGSITMIDGTSLDPIHYGGVGQLSHVWLATGAIVTLTNFSFSDEGAAQLLFNLGQAGATLRLIDTEIPADYAALIKNYHSTIEIIHTPTGIELDGGNVAENSASGTVVGTLTAIDPDGGPIAYAITGGASDLFEIAGDKILVKAGAMLDYETAKEHILSVTATDSTGLSVTQQVTIDIGDIADTVTSGADYLVGTGGRLAGAAGNDTYLVTSSADQVVELSGQGTDTVKTTLGAYALGANLENLVYVGEADFTGSGNSANNALTGGNGRDTLRGGNGNDLINGGAGDDAIFGDGNRDQLRGGDGNDALRGGAWDDKLWGDNGDDTLTGDDGTDYLAGGSGNDWLDGGTGADQMVGSKGDDTFIVNMAGETVNELANEGIDTVRAGTHYTLGANVENLVLTGTGSLTGTGNGLANLILGNAGANTLTGGSGNDILDGGAGDDRLIGGAGGDTYIFGQGHDAAVGGAGDVLRFGEGVRIDQVWLEQYGQDLIVSLLGSDDQTAFEGWFGPETARIDHLEFADGSRISAEAASEIALSHLPGVPDLQPEDVIPTNA